MASFHQHYSTYTLQTYQEHQFRSWPTQMTSPSHLHTQVRVQQRNTYNHTYIQFCLDKTKQARPKSHIQHTHSQHLSKSTHATTNDKKTLTATGWGKQTETHMATYKAVMRPALEYASSIWSPLASSTSINKLLVMQNSALRTPTGCTQDTSIQHLHDKTLTLPIHEHLQLHASQYKQKTQHPSHPLHKHTPYFNTLRIRTPQSITTAATQQTFPQTPTQSLQQT